MYNNKKLSSVALWEKPEKSQVFFIISISRQNVLQINESEWVRASVRDRNQMT